MHADTVDALDCPRSRQGLRGLAIATFAFLTVFAASAVPIPLYSEYKGTIGLTDADISATMLMYLFGVIATLFLSGSLSDAAGRRPLTAVALLLAMLGCFMFLNAEDAMMVLAARAVQGVSCGLAMSAVSALVVDSAQGRYEGVGLAVAGCGALLGVMAGSLAVGFLSLVTDEHDLIYGIMIGLLALGVALVPLAPETVTSRVALRTACKPVVSVDPKLRSVLPVAACAYIASWGVGTFFQSFSSPVAVECFGSSDPFTASAILALSMAPSALGAPIEARMPSGTSLRVSMAALLVFTCAMCAAMAAGALAVFLVLVALFGLSTGMCLSGSLRLLFAKADVRSTATVVSTINLIGYTGSAVLSGIMGALVGVTTLVGVLAVLAIVAAVAVVTVFVRTRQRSSGGGLCYTGLFRRNEDESCR